MTAIRKLSLLILLLLGTTYAGAEEIASIPLQDDDILSPSSSPTEKPSTPSLNNAPTTAPTLKPTDTPTFNPAAAPSEQPTDELSTKPTSPPSKAQLPDLPEALEGAPSATPTEKPSSMPSVYSEPSTFPSEIPTAEPSLGPSQVPSVGPSNLPSAQPSLRPSLSQAPSIVLSESPSNTPSTLPSKMPSQTPSDIPSDIPSATPTSAPSSQPTALPSSTPSATPSFKPSDTPSLVPTASPSVIPSLEPSQREQEALELQTDSPSTKPAYSPPKTASPTTSLFKSNGQYETIISVEIDGLKTILDEAEEIILENTILRFLSDKILDIQGISIFFLKTKLLRQTLVKNNRKLSSEKTFIMDVQVQAITVGGEIDPAIYHDVVQSTITENSDQFYARLQTISESFSGRVAAGQSGQEANEASPKNEDGMSMVIITAILVSTAIFVVGLLVACFAAYSRNKRRADKYERQIERVMSSMKSRASKSFKNDGTFTIGIPDEIQSINRSHSAPLSPDIEKNFPKRFSETSEASYDGGHNYKAEYCSDYPTDENEGMEEVELVEIAEEDASVAQVAAITGGSDRVQTAEMLCHHGYRGKFIDTPQSVPEHATTGSEEIRPSFSRTSIRSKKSSKESPSSTLRKGNVWSLQKLPPSMRSSLSKSFSLKSRAQTSKYETPTLEHPQNLSIKRQSSASQPLPPGQAPSKEMFALTESNIQETTNPLSFRRKSSGDMRSVRSSRTSSSRRSHVTPNKDAGDILSDLDSLEGNRGVTPTSLEMSRNQSSRAHHRRSMDSSQHNRSYYRNNAPDNCEINPYPNRSRTSSAASSRFERERSSGSRTAASATSLDSSIYSNSSFGTRSMASRADRSTSAASRSALTRTSSRSSSIGSFRTEEFGDNSVHTSRTRSSNSKSSASSHHQRPASPNGSVVSSDQYSQSSSSDTDSQFSESDLENKDDSFLLKLKQTVSTAAFSRATDTASKNSASAPYVRKMSMSASSGATHMSSASPSGRKSTNTHRRLPPQVNETSGLEAAASMFGY